MILPQVDNAQLWGAGGLRAGRGKIGDTDSWWGLGGSQEYICPLAALATMTMGAISFVRVQVLPLVSLQLRAQLMGTYLDLLLGKSLP